MPETILVVLLALLLFLAAWLIIRATFYGKVPPPVDPVELPPVDAQAAAERLSAAIRQATVSGGERGRAATRSFEDLREAVERMYPNLHAVLQRERINDHSLLYCWPGRAAETELEPVLLCAHMDVVPADPVTELEWTHPPYSGRIADGYVWGRGALDMKSSLIAILDAVEALVTSGYQPERTLYLAFGHDEEIGGWQGGRCIADFLVERGVRLSAVLDEGPGILEELIPGVSVPVAAVGVAEKGHAAIEMRVEGRPGHSSLPPRHTAIGVLARAITRVENHPRPARMDMAYTTLEALGPFLPFAMRLALANAWLFGGRVRRLLEARPTTSAAVRTTTAVTLIQGGVKDNVLPAQARAVINARLFPGDTPADVLEHVRRVVDDEAVQISLIAETAWQPSPVSPVDSPAYTSLSETVRQVFPEAVVAPTLVPAADDARHYTRLCSHVLRFSPYRLDPALQRAIHGVDERISVEALGRMIQFYAQLIKTWTSLVGRA